MWLRGGAVGLSTGHWGLHLICFCTHRLGWIFHLLRIKRGRKHQLLAPQPPHHNRRTLTWRCRRPRGTDVNQRSNLSEQEGLDMFGDQSRLLFVQADVNIETGGMLCAASGTRWELQLLSRWQRTDRHKTLEWLKVGGIKPRLRCAQAGWARYRRSVNERWPHHSCPGATDSWGMKQMQHPHGFTGVAKWRQLDF